MAAPWVAFILFFLVLNVAGDIPVIIRPDCGTCGNACCTMEYIIFGPHPPEAFEIISSTLKNGGPDGKYFFIDGRDIRPENQTAQFIIQGGHSSSNYMDMLNFAFYDNPKVMATTVIAFSISTEPAKFCDDGENYINLVTFMNTIDFQITEVHVAGCPPAPILEKKPLPKKPSIAMMKLHKAKILP